MTASSIGAERFDESTEYLSGTHAGYCRVAIRVASLVRPVMLVGHLWLCKAASEHASRLLRVGSGPSPKPSA